MNYFVKTPKLLHSLYRNAVWFIPNSKNEIYLTFDDGPIPEITEKCLDILQEFDIKATFFCVGQNVERHPEIYNRILANGHAVGNHSYNHISGWKTELDEYLDNISKCNELVDSKLLRPPYGKIKRSQLKIVKENYTVVMWDVLSADFDPKVSTNDCIANVIDNTESGSIIVMHDNEKCGSKMLEALPTTIKLLKEKGFLFKTLSA